MKYAQIIDTFIVHFDGGFEMRSEAQKKADKRYNDKIRYKKYTPLNLSVLSNDYDFINNFCKLIGLSKAQTIVNAVKYCYIHNIDLHEQIEMPATSAELLQPGSIEDEKEE